jgi:hypothetical protein
MITEPISMLHKKDNGNVIIHQVLLSDESLSIQEVKPLRIDSSINLFFSLKNNILKWEPFELNNGSDIYITNNNGVVTIDASVDTRVIVNDRLRETNIYYVDERIGVGRVPMYTYKLDIAVPENTLITALHVGDGTYGFSMGNGTSQGFIPEIIGMGADENDAGLYFIGRAGNQRSSSIPLIILDARNSLNGIVTNRPLFGVTSGQYDKYKFLIDKLGDVKADGNVRAKDFILDSSISLKQLVNTIIEQNNEIDILKNKVTKILKNKGFN